jgi:cell division protein FtsN
MPKDYAKHVSKSKRPRVVHGWRKRLLLVVLLILLCLVGIFSYSIYQKTKTNETLDAINGWIKQVKTFFVTKKEKDIVEQITDEAASNPEPNDDIQFSFYTNLSAMQVAAKDLPPPAEVVKTPTPATPKQTPMAERYLLQIGAYRNPTAAGEMRISLLLDGFEAEIVKALNNGQQIYQLQQGPFRSIAEAKSMQREMKRKGIESVIIKKVE